MSNRDPFEYLLNDLEFAASDASPYQAGYGKKRLAVLTYVTVLRDDLIKAQARIAELERERDALRADAERRNLKAELLSACVKLGLLRLKSERMVNIDQNMNTRCSWIEHGERSAMDISNDAYDAAIDAAREGK